MNHKEFIRINANANTAILFIHGIIGTPDHFDPFLPLVPYNVSVCNILLDGHGKDVHEFSRTSMKKWETQVSNIIADLSQTHTDIYIVAHSMGTLLAIEQAICSDVIKGLFLLAIPIKIFPRKLMFTNAWKVYRNKVKTTDTFAIAAKNSCSIHHEGNLFAYIGWIPRYLELFKKSHRIHKNMQLLRTQTVAFQSKMDEMVSYRSVKALVQVPAISVYTLKNSTHFCYDAFDLQFLIAEFNKFLSHIK